MVSKFTQYAAEASNRMFLGRLIKFRKGDWEEGSGQIPISPNKPFVAVMDTVTIGHMKWGGGKPTDSKMGLVADGFRPLHRNALGDLDSMTWEVDDNNDRVDPWQPTTLIVLISADESHDLFTFSTSTVGGHSAVGDLCAAHGRTTEEAGQYPVVTLASDSYDHKIKSRGRVIVPVFKIVDCVEAGSFNAMVAEARGGAGFIPASPPPLAARGADSIAIAPIEDVPEMPTDDEAPPLEHDGGPDDQLSF
jgi:hypothetical protein